jgi:hypothetical protein
MSCVAVSINLMALTTEEKRQRKADYMRAWRAKNGARTGKRGPAPSAACGTRSGYHRHYREGTPVCVACASAEADYKRALRLKAYG